jgi:hypothetical protein
MSLRGIPSRLTAWCLLALLLPRTLALAGETLDSLRKEVEKNDERGDDSGTCDTDDSDDDCDGGLVLEGRPLIVVLGAPWWLPHVALDDDLSSLPDFPAAPYADNVGGRLLIGSTSSAEVRGWSGRAGAHFGTNYGDLKWSTIRLQMDSAPRFGFDAEWTHWTESMAARGDTLDTGDVNLLYRFAQSEQIEFHTGMGVNWLAEGSDGEAGMNFTYGVSAFPARPWTISAAIDAGTLGDAGYFHARAGAGIIWERCELFTGYDVCRIGDVNLDGMFAGIAFWF